MNKEAMPNSAQRKRVKTGGGPAFHSRLESHVAFIRQQRRQRKTWKEIAERLGAERGCPITLQGVHQFYRRQVRFLARPHWERDAPVAEPQQKPRLVAVPPARSFRRPNPNAINLNDPSKL